LFVDEVDIHVEAGHGGRGCLAFRREKLVPRGGPSGGDGGHGGSVYFVASPHINTLINYRYHPLSDAEPGQHGMGSNCTGKAGGDLELAVGKQKLRINRAVLNQRPALRGYLGKTVVVGIRPEDMEDASLVPDADGGQVESKADLVEAMGSDVLIHFVVDAPQVVTDDTKELARDVGTDVLGLDQQPHTDLVARFSPRTRVRDGDTVTVHIATDRLHYFDPDTGLSIWGD